MVLCFGFCDENSVDNAPMFWLLLLHSTCAVSKLSLFLTLPPLPSEIDWGGQEIRSAHSWDR